MAIPSEHGGWGLTLEPVLLGLMLAPSVAGAAIGGAAFVAFLCRTPLKLVLVDVWRRRWLPRTSMAAVFASIELMLAGALVAVAVASAGWLWWWPVLIAGPLVAVELAFEARSRGRRLIPELCGAVGIEASVAAIVVAGDGSTRLALAAWLILVARSIAAVVHVRVQIARLRHGTGDQRLSDALQPVGVLIAVVAVAVETSVIGGLIVMIVIAAAHVAMVRQPPLPPKEIGLQQMLMGFVLVATTAIGVLLA
ncbi:MAG: YwiC-like family protein [Acidimicrobiia bacterium]